MSHYYTVTEYRFGEWMVVEINFRCGKVYKDMIRVSDFKPDEWPEVRRQIEEDLRTDHEEDHQMRGASCWKG